MNGIYPAHIVRTRQDIAVCRQLRSGKFAVRRTGAGNVAFGEVDMLERTKPRINPVHCVSVAPNL
jgi:hypothetical protein